MRLTEFRKAQNQYFCKDFKVDKEKGLIVSVVEFNEAVVNKLGELEDIEEKLGVNLETLFKALNDGFYIKYNDDIVRISPDKHITVNFWYGIINVFIPPKLFIDCKKGIDHSSEAIDEEYWFKDYGKTWALTDEELKAKNYRPIISIDKNLCGDGKDWYRATFQEFPNMIGGIGLTEEEAIDAGYAMLRAEIKFRKEEGLDIPGPKEELQ